MQIFLDEVAARHLNDRIVMVLDGAGWHKSGSLMIPNNLRLLSLPPYSPELNPVEHIWDDLREKEFHNRVFDSIRLRGEWKDLLCLPLYGKLLRAIDADAHKRWDIMGNKVVQDIALGGICDHPIIFMR